MICESTNVFVDYLFGGEYFVNKLYIFVISMLLCIFWYQNIFNCLIRASPRSEELPLLMKFLKCWYKYLLIICSEVNILLTNYIYLLSACFCTSFDAKIFSITLIRAPPRSEELPPLMNFLTCWYKYLLINCSEVNILLTNYIYLLLACFCASFDTKIFSIA